VKAAPILTLLATSLWAAQDAAPTFDDLATRATAARNTNDAKTAIGLYRQALQLNPNWEEGWWFLGSLQYEADQYAKGAESLSRLVNLRPSAGPGWALLGLCEYQTGNYGPALEHIQRSLAAGVGNQEQMAGVLRFHEALLLTRTGDFDGALQKFSGLITPGISDPQVLLALGLATLRQPITPREVRKDQQDALLIAGKAMAYLFGGDHARAQQAFQELVNRYGTVPNAHYAYGFFLFSSDPNGAAEEWKRELSVDSGNAAAHGMLAWICFLRDDWDGALKHAETASANDPTVTVAQIVLGRALVRKGEVQTGLLHLEKAAAREPANLEAHLALATAYSEAGRKQEARRERQLCLQMKAEAGSIAAR